MNVSSKPRSRYVVESNNYRTSNEPLANPAPGTFIGHQAYPALGTSNEHQVNPASGTFIMNNVYHASGTFNK